MLLALFLCAPPRVTVDPIHAGVRYTWVEGTAAQVLECRYDAELERSIAEHDATRKIGTAWIAYACTSSAPVRPVAIVSYEGAPVFVLCERRKDRVRAAVSRIELDLKGDPAVAHECAAWVAALTRRPPDDPPAPFPISKSTPVALRDAGLDVLEGIVRVLYELTQIGRER